MKRFFTLVPKCMIVLFLGYLCFLPLVFNIVNLLNNCINIYDFGIYEQAIYEIAGGAGWNPYLTARNVHIFNDHFVPVIFLAVPWAMIFKYNPVSLVVFEWLWFAVTIVMIILISRKRHSFYEICFYIMFFCLSRAILSGLAYPIHPTTWAVLPLFLMVFCLYRDRFCGVFLSCFALMFFKESFAFGVFGLSFFYLLRREYRNFLIILVLSSFFIIFEMKLRELWFGKTVAYGNRFLGVFFADPVGFLAVFDYKSFLKIFVPYLIPMFFIIKNDWNGIKKIVKKPIAGVFFFLIPMLGIHFISNRFYFHHAGKFGIVLSAVCVFSGICSYIPRKKIIYFLMVLFFLLPASSIIKKMSRRVFFPETAKECVISREKRKMTGEIRGYFQKQDLSKIKIWSTGGIIQNVMLPGMRIYHASNYVWQGFYTHLLLEMNHSGDIYPLKEHDVETIRSGCAPYVETEIMNNSQFYLASGVFPDSCIMQSSFWD